MATATAPRTRTVEPEQPSGRRLTVNYLLLTGGESLAKVFTLVAFVYLGRILGPERYGSLEFVLATMIFFTLPVDFGLGVYGARELARDRLRAADLLREVSSLRLVLASVSFVLLVLLAAFLPREGEVKLLLLFYGLSLFIEPMLVQWFFQGHDCMHWVALAELTRKGTFACCVLLVVRPGMSLAWIGICEIASALAVAAVCFIVLRRRLGFSPPRPWQPSKHLKAHLLQSAPIGLSHLAWAAQWYFATVLMGWLATPEELGWYGASFRVVMALHTFVYLYFYNLLPSLSRSAGGSTRELRRLLSFSLGLTSWGGLLTALMLTLIGGDVLSHQWAYGSRFVSVQGPLAVLGWLIPAALLGGHYRYLLIASGLQHLEMRGTVFAAISAILLGLLLIPAYGAVGAAAALLAANIISFGFAYLFTSRRIETIPCHRHVTLPLLAAGAAFGCSTALAAWGPWTRAGAGLLVYLALFAVWLGWILVRKRSELPPLDSALVYTTVSEPLAN